MCDERRALTSSSVSDVSTTAEASLSVLLPGKGSYTISHILELHGILIGEVEQEDAHKVVSITKK